MERLPVSAAQDKSIITLEGLGTPEKPDHLQAAFITEQAAQCGYCTSGMVMTAKALLATQAAAAPPPAAEEAYDDDEAFDVEGESEVESEETEGLSEAVSKTNGACCTPLWLASGWECRGRRPSTT